MGALHQALRRIRRYTELEVIVRDGTCKIQSLWEAIFYDVQEFERLIAKPADRESMQQAMALYRGDFLPSAPSSAVLWVDARRVHLQQRYLDALEQFATAVERETPQLAVDYYQRILQIDGCREHTAATLMQLAARFGNRSLLHATFEQLNIALRSLGATPDPTVVQLYKQLR
jgi:two-component SAPR family response regulator